jgi:pilus assembly protein Flp/PilA
VKDFAADACGATAIEYALVASLIAMVIITVVASVGTKLSSTFYAAMATAP